MAELNDKKLFRLIKFAPASIVILFTIVLLAIVIEDDIRSSAQEIDSLHQEFVSRQKELLKNQVEYVEQQIQYAKDQTQTTLETTIKQRIHEAHKIATNLYENNQGKSEEEVTALITQALRDIRFNDGRGYFFIYKTNGINVMHPLLPHVEGKSLWDFKDVRGSYIVREMGEQVKAKGEAFYRWWFVKPQNKNQEFEKIGFGQYFEPYDWFIGTGDYVVDVENDIKKQVLQWVSGIRFGTYGYIFILDNKGELLAHREPEFVGKNIYDLSQDRDKEAIGKLVVNHQKYVHYKSAYIPDGVNGGDKISYVMQFKDWNWSVGSGVYVDVLEAYLNERRAYFEVTNRSDLTQVALMGGATALILALLSFGLSRVISVRFEKFQAKIENDFGSLEDTKNQLEHMALHDSLTGLPNRVLLHDHIEQGIERSKASYQQLAVMFVDLDDFKKVNDVYGHSAGDLLLGEIGKKFEELMSPGESISRFGGDEFVFCFPCLESLAEAEQKVELIKSVFDRQFVVQGRVIFISCTIGVSMYPSDGDEPEDLISKADIVLYKSKARQKGDVLFFDNAINRQVQYDFLLERELRDALYRKEISVLYQPQIDVKTGKLCGVEALSRWHNAQLGHVSPVEFIAVAEDIGLINTIGMFVINQACQDISEAFPTNASNIALSINISPIQLMSNQFVPQLCAAIDAHHIGYERITLEITENVLINDLVKVSPVIEALRSLGITISLDDFGTGYSSLSYLSNLPINEIKIDRSFVDKMMSSKQSDSLVKAIIAIGHSSEMKIVAEGVETQAQRDILESYHCDILQGYLIDKPLPLAQLVTEYPKGREH